MKYLCLVYAEPGAFDQLDAAAKFRLDTDSLDYDKQLQREGSFIAAEALVSTSEAQTVRVRPERTTFTDGPFAETREHLCGFILIEARDFNDALRIAADIPMARIGSVEVRPVLQIVPVPA